ncbi:MAG: helix-turn-helix domain-containing protein [Patescibacteria group bacterium]|jgi:sugar-specific transcriptional regulator TrmB
MIEEKVLKDLGLTDIESKVYLATLALGQETVLKIAKKAEIKRPTCYVTLNNLFEKGFVTRIDKKNTTIYSAESPKIILNKYKEKVANFEDLVPYFESQFNKGPKPKIRYYEGKNEIWNVYTKIIYPSRQIYFFGSDIEKINKTFPELFDYFDKTQHGDNKEIMELVSYNEEGKKFYEKYKDIRQERLMPPDLPAFADCAITEDKLFIVSFDNMFGVLIESEDLAKTFKNFFMLAWRAVE